MTVTKALKSLVFSLAAAVSLWTGAPALAAGTTPLSLVQQFDSSGAPLAGCQLYFFFAGSNSALQNAYQDFGLTVPLSNPVTCDQSGRVPQHWLADGLIHIRLTDSAGLAYVDTTMQVLGPSSGGGGGGSTVDPTTVLQTGDMKARYATGPIAGFVRANGLTLGNATSGATERANADTQALFISLYQSDPNLVVSGGRTGNALTDYNANKTIALPDGRGRLIAGLDDMGNSAAGRLTAAYFGTSATVLGATGGAQNQTLLTANLPAFTPTGTIANGTISVTVSGVNAVAGASAFSMQSGGGTAQAVPVGSGTVTITQGSSIFTGTAQGGTSSPITTAQPTILTTIYIKL